MQFRTVSSYWVFRGSPNALMLISAGDGMGQVSRELGISTRTLGEWKSPKKQPPRPTGGAEMNLFNCSSPPGGEPNCNSNKAQH